MTLSAGKLWGRMKSKNIRCRAYRLLAGFLLLCSLLAGCAGEASELRCEYQSNPLGIDTQQPRLSWILDPTIWGTATRGQRQTAYQILVASSAALLNQDHGDRWDSGKVVSDQCSLVEYQGKPLASRMRCYWKVRVWDQDGRATGWSPPVQWTMGLLDPGDWTAQWITAPRWYMPPDLRPRGLVVSIGGWADVDLGEPLPIDSIKLYFLNTNAIPKRFQILGAYDLQFSHSQILVDQSAADYQSSGTGPQVFALNGAKFRRIRLWLTNPSAQANVLTRPVQTSPGRPAAQVEVRQMEVISGGKNVALMRPTREIGTPWDHGHAVFLVDGMPSAQDGNDCPPDACPTTAAPMLRKTFMVHQPVQHATLYVAALGMADVTINGRPVTDSVLGPPFTDYTKRVVYLTQDITAQLTNGENVIGVVLGNGFFSTPRGGFGERHGGNGPPRVLIQAELEYVDGTCETVNSDATWKWSPSEIVDNDTFALYTEDRRLGKPGWNYPGYDDTKWRSATNAVAPGGRLVAPLGPPIRVVGELKPFRVETNHAYFQVLSAGWPRVKVNGRAGQTIVILGHAAGYHAPPLTFTLATNGPAVLEPRFMYLSGPLEIEVKGLAEPLTPDAVTIELVHANLQMAGAFACANPWLNQVYAALLQTHLNYDGDQPMDPMREKQGWTQDMQGMFETAAYMTDVAGLYRKWWWDMADAEDESGYLGSVLPLVGRQVYDWNSPWWSGVVVLLPWQHYQYYGDRRLLAEAYEAMRRYVDFLGALTASGSVRGWNDYPYRDTGDDQSIAARDGILSWLGAGDWQNPYGGKGAVPAPLLDMPAWYHYATIVSRVADLLGKPADARKYSDLAQAVKTRFNAKYLNPETGLYGSETNCQTAQALPLALGLVPALQCDLTYRQLLAAIHARNDHQGAGFVGLPFLLATLTDHSETALANKMVNQQDYPGWKTLIHDGVFAEGWNGGGAQMPSCGGAVGMWLYQSVLGIRPDPTGPGFKKFLLAPQPDLASGLTWARGSYDSVYGHIVSDWTCENGHFNLHAVIPANTTATVFVPTRDATSVTESGKPASQAEYVNFLRMENHSAVYVIGSGSYHFQSILP